MSSRNLHFERRMSDPDALMWTIEMDPLLRSTITSVSILDRAPDRERFTDQLEREPVSGPPPPARRPFALQLGPP